MPVAFCLVENDSGQVLLIQRGYGKEKYKWSLPGGNVDGEEGYQRAAARETREETGLQVKIISTIMVGRTHAIQSFYGIIAGGALRAKRPECLDARFFSYHNLPDLAFGADRRAIDSWLKMETHHKELATKPPPSRCPYCDSEVIRIRQYPHKNPYRCQSCKRTLQSSSRPNVIKHSIGSEPSPIGWEQIGGWNTWDNQKYDMSRVPKWVMDMLPNLDLHHAPGSHVYELVGRNYRYIVAASGQGATSGIIWHKPRLSTPTLTGKSNTPSHDKPGSELDKLLGLVWEDPKV